MCLASSHVAHEQSTGAELHQSRDRGCLERGFSEGPCNTIRLSARNCCMFAQVREQRAHIFAPLRAFQYVINLIIIVLSIWKHFVTQGVIDALTQLFPMRCGLRGA